MTRRSTVSKHVEEATFLNGSLTYTKGARCSAKMVYKRVKGWIAVRNPSVLNVAKYPPPPRAV